MKNQRKRYGRRRFGIWASILIPMTFFFLAESLSESSARTLLAQTASEGESGPTTESDFFFDDAGDSENAEVADEKSAESNEGSKTKETGKKERDAKKSGLLAGLLGGGAKDDGKSDYRTPLETVLPADTLMMLRTLPIERFNADLRSLLNRLGFGEISPLDWIRLSPYGRALTQVDRSRPLGACWIVGRKSPEPGIVLFVPIRHFLPFVDALGGDVAPFDSDGAVPAGTVFTLTKPLDWVCVQNKGYALILEKKNQAAVESLLKARPVGANLFSPAGLTAPDFRLEVTGIGIRHFTELNRTAESQFRRLMSVVSQKIDESAAELDITSGEVATRLDRFVQWSNRNLSELAFEGKISDGRLLTSFVFVPARGSELAAQIDNTGGPETPTLLDQPQFLKVLPDVPSVFTGQTDVLPDFAAKLDSPFHRVRHVEYSFGLPRGGELLAESWAFFLEVDDAEAFVQELIIPKAQLIGSQIGSDTVGQLAGQILGNLSMRRQMSGRRPLLFNSPDEAAAAGQSFGSQVGAEIGSSAGEKEGMKKRDFEGYPLYVSDLVLYTQEMKKFRARQRGENAPPAVFLTGEPTLRLMIANIVSGLQTGTLEGVIQDQFKNLAGDGIVDGSPLLARQNLILLLDKKHLLIIPGNEDLLREAKNRWREFTTRDGERVETASDGSDGWRADRDALFGAMADGSSQILRSAARFDLAAARALSGYFRKHYAPDFPQMMDKPVPDGLSNPFFLSTNAPEAGYLYASFPDDFLKFAVRARMEKAKKGGTSAK